HDIRGQHHLVSRRTSPLYRHIRHLASPVEPTEVGLSAGRGAKHTGACFAGSQMVPLHFGAGVKGSQEWRNNSGESVNGDVPIRGSTLINGRIGHAANCTVT